MTFSPFFFFFFVSHLSFSGFFSLSLTLSLTAHQIRLAIRNIPTSNPFATSQHQTYSQHPNTEPIHNDPFCRTHSRRSHLRRSPFTTIPIHDDLAESFAVAAKSFAVLVAFACSSSLVLAVVAFARYCRTCSLSSHLLAVVAFAHRRRFCLLVVTEACSSSLKLDRRRRSNPSNISAPSHTDASASFRRFSSHGPSTSTHTDCSTSLRRFKPQRSFGFHFNR